MDYLFKKRRGSFKDNGIGGFFSGAQRLIDRYQVVIGIILLLAIAGAGIAWLFQEDRGRLDKTVISQLSGELRVLREQNEQLLAQLRQIEEKHNRLVQDLVNQQVAGVQDSSDGQPASQQAGQSVDINRATFGQLVSLPGIGPVKAQRIIDYRKANGGFKSVEELVNVRGIGEKTLEKLRDKIKI
jgi:competence protein ComEA